MIMNDEDIVTCIPIARQRVGKNIPAENTSGTMGRLLLGNVVVNTHFNNRRLCFPWGPCKLVIRRFRQGSSKRFRVAGTMEQQSEENLVEFWRQ
jgi:hypothetical protein